MGLTVEAHIRKFAPIAGILFPLLILAGFLIEGSPHDVDEPAAEIVRAIHAIWSGCFRPMHLGLAALVAAVGLVSLDSDAADANHLARPSRCSSARPPSAAAMYSSQSTAGGRQPVHD